MNLFWCILFCLNLIILLCTTNEHADVEIKFDLLPLDHDSRLSRTNRFGLNMKSIIRLFDDTKSIKEIFEKYWEWHDVVIQFFYLAVAKSTTNNVMSVEIIHSILANAKSIEDLSNYYISLMCHRMNRTDIPEVQKRSRVNNPNLCPSPCKLERCDDVTYAIKNSCKKTGFFDGDYRCSCLSPWMWDLKSKLCVKPNYKDICKKE